MFCEYCSNESEPGWIETDNNGPIVPCPFCNPDDEPLDDMIGAYDE